MQRKCIRVFDNYYLSPICKPKLLVFVIFNYIVVAEWSKTRFKGIKATTAMKEYRYKCSGCKKPTSDVSTLLYYLLPQAPKIDGRKSDLANTLTPPESVRFRYLSPQHLPRLCDVFIRCIVLPSVSSQ